MGEQTRNTQWFKEHRDYFVARVVQDFLMVGEAVSTLELAHSKKAPIYSHLSQMVGDPKEKGILWRLKDRCHQLWRDADPDREADSFFFDWMVGAMFHEAMKLKENAYMLERYAPSYEIALKRMRNEADSTQCRRFFKETLKDMEKGIERIRCLFKNAASRLRYLIREERENGVLIRLLIEELDRAEHLLMETGTPLLGWLFPEGQFNAYLIAGESYLEGGWYQEARIAFEEALRLEPSCVDARNGLMILEKRLKEVTLYGPGGLVMERGMSFAST